MAFSLAQLSIIQRPYEKLQILGSASLSNEELLAIILQAGHKGKSSLDLASDLLANDMVGHSLRQLNNLEVNDLLEIKGIGLAKAARLLACVELAKRLLHDSAFDNLQLQTPETVFKFILPFVDQRIENIFALFLDCHLQLLHMTYLGQGGLTAAKFDSKAVLRSALRYNAKNVILVHNHPSGDVQASATDCQTTELLSKLLVDYAINLLDHIIITERSYLSLFRDKAELFVA